MRKLQRDLVLILRTEAKNQRTPPIDYVIAEDGGRMVHRPEPDIAMAELLEEAAAALAAKDAELAEARANRTDAHGWLFNNPDTGIEWLDQHPTESGEVPDAENVRPASAEEVVTLLREAWNALAAERATLAEKDKEIAALREERDFLQEILDTRPAINAALPESYIRWSQSLYSGEAVRASLSARNEGGKDGE